MTSISEVITELSSVRFWKIYKFLDLSIPLYITLRLYDRIHNTFITLIRSTRRTRDPCWVDSVSKMFPTQKRRGSSLDLRPEGQSDTLYVTRHESRDTTAGLEWTLWQWCIERTTAAEVQHIACRVQTRQWDILALGSWHWIARIHYWMSAVRKRSGELWACRLSDICDCPAGGANKFPTLIIVVYQLVFCIVTGSGRYKKTPRMV